MTQKQLLLTKPQPPPLAKQHNNYDCGPIVLLDAVNLVHHLSPDSSKVLSPPNDLRQRLAADLSKGSFVFTTTKNADPKEVCSNITALINNKQVEASRTIGPVLDNIPVTKKMLQHFLRNARLTSDDMNAPLQLLRDTFQGNNTIAILDAEFCQRAERSVTDTAVAPNYLKWMLMSHGITFDFAQVKTVWIPMYLPDPDKPDGKFAHWWRLLYDTSSGTFSRGCSLGNQTQSKYSAQENAARAFLVKLTEVYISPPMSPRSRKHDCAYYSEKRTNA
jgi:hypothetical protein